MNEHLMNLIESSKELALDRITSSRMVCKGPCLVYFLLSEPVDVATALILTVYDGENDQGDLKLKIKTQYGSCCCSLHQPAYFRRGLYIDLTTNLSSCSVQYLPLKD